MIKAFSENPPLPEGFLSQGIISYIGRTPLIPITRLIPESSDVRVFAKAEFMNPGGSVKDRAAWSMIKEGVMNGLLTPEKTLLDATSGNTGIAYAMICASLGFKVELCVPKNASPERINLMKSYGASLILTDPLEGTDGAILKARELFDASPESYFYADQYNNNANWLAHYQNTAIEILDQTASEITHFVAGLGTSGTFVGTTKRLKEDIPNLQAISVQPNSPFHGIEGLKHMESALIPGILDVSLIDEDIRVTTKEAQLNAIRLAREEGMLVGISSGAALAAALHIATKMNHGIIVCIFPDRGERYLGDNIWR
ncbi:MAG: PLP-dependent cysteine synthase family protein [Candidatus Kariarchaeaceae archaeon]|jgi:cysteine synthase B